MKPELVGLLVGLWLCYGVIRTGIKTAQNTNFLTQVRYSDILIGTIMGPLLTLYAFTVKRWSRVELKARRKKEYKNPVTENRFRI